MSTGTLRQPFAASWQRWLVLALVLLFFAALSAKYTVKVTDPHAPRSAIQRWYDQLKSLDEDANPWERFNYPNPPIMALLLRPLLLLPPVPAALVWFYLKVGLTLLAFSWVFRLVEVPDQPFPPWAKALTVLLAVRPVMGDLIHGNVNLFILFLVVAALYAFRRGRDVTSGLLLALAVACKVTPALFIPYLVWKRSWKALLGCGVGLVLFFWLVPACFLGWQKNAEDLRSWVDNMVVPFVVKGNVTSEHNNQSLPGLVFRMTTHSPSFSRFDEHDHYVPLEYDNVLSLDPAAARLLVKGCMAVFALLVVWACRTPTAPRHGWRLAAEFAIILLGMLLFSERTWKHHCVTLVVPFAVIAYYLAACRPGGALRGYLIGSLVVVAFLMLATSTGLFEEVHDQGAVPASLPLTNRVGKLAQLYGAYVWAYLILLAALAVLLRRKEPSVPGGQ